MNRISRTILAFVRRPVLAIAACTSAIALASAAPLFAAPAIDGNIDDMITYANGLNESDDGCGMFITDRPDVNGNPTPETIYNDLKFIPCPQPQPALGTHWINGVEIFNHVLAYTPGSTTLYLGLRAEGYIGDSDGNNNPDNAGGGACNPAVNIEDLFGIGGNELYSWSFDLDCNGLTDGTIKVQDNVIVGSGTLAGATGTFAFRQGGSATGKDLEIQVTLAAPLPAAFRFVRVEANAFDGLSEDRSDGGVCISTPEINVLKSAVPVSVCVGQSTRFTLTVQNTGLTPLTVAVVDSLPATLSYAGGLSSTCGVGAPVVNGSVLTFPTFVLAAGADCTISFDALASPQCFGSATNVVHVTGTFASACIEGSGQIAVEDRAEFGVVCKSLPCVEVTAQGPAAACPGAPVTISGTAKNCSLDPETIVVTVNGIQAYSNTVAAGATINWTLDTTMPAECAVGQNSTFRVSATGTSDCGTDTETTSVLVRCKDKPCVELTANRNPASACPGDEITISGTVKNCSIDPETIVVTINGEQVFNQVVAGGATADYTKTLIMPACTAGQSVNYSVVATATGDCPPAATQTIPLSVLCKSLPCVNVTAEANKAAACPNEEVTISGIVTNCGADPATYTVTVGGVQVFSGILQPGGFAPYSRVVSMGECVANANVTFAVVATATNACGSDTENASASVRCKDKPCVELTANRNPASACPGDAITVSGTVKNCSLETETIVVTINGEQVFNQSVAAGATADYTKGFVMPACIAGNSVDYTVVATASGDCPPVARQTLVVSVLCKNPPCVALTNVVANKASACPNEAVVVSGTVTNCGTDSATFTVTVGGVQVFTGTLAPGASQNFSRDVTMGACVAGNNVTWQVVASAVNSCGNDSDDASVSVRCRDLPCVELTADRNPASACPGDQVTVSGTVKNCSLDRETIVVTINGEQVLNQGVAAGATVSYSKNFVMPACTAGQSVDYAIVAIATNDCDQVGQRKDATVSVLCKNPPCVLLTDVVANKPTACPDEAVVISGKVKNCGTDSATFTVTVGGVQVFTGTLAPGAEQNFSRNVTMGSCVAGNNVTWQVVANAVNSCGNVSDNASVSVLCKAGPCVEASALCDPQSACPGTPITVTGSAKNCGLEAADITITIEGQSQTFPGIAPGQSASWSRTIPLRECTSGSQVTFNVSATATNSCGVSRPSTASCSVTCLKPQVQIDKTVSPSGAVDQGTVLHYTIRVTNPASFALENVVVTDVLCEEVTFQGNAVPAPSSGPAIGANGTLVWNLGTIAAGGSVTITFDVLVRSLSSPACENERRSCTNTAVVTGNCASASTRAEDSVRTDINPCEVPGLCRLTGGGCLNENGSQRGHKQSTFGGNASPEHTGGGPTGNEWQHVYRDGRTILFNWHSHDAHVIACSVVSPGPCSPHAINTRADFVGTGLYSVGPGGREIEGNMVAYIIDHREGSCNKGTRDEYSIVIRTGLVIGQGTIVFQTSGYIDCGNLQIHETPGRLFGNGISTGSGIAGAAGVELLNRPYPNPFSGTTNFAYKVETDGAKVEVGVYNVAGRLVKTLAGGPKSVGTYMVTWDGSDESGVRMAPGVYFLKSHVGEGSTVSRLIYVAR